LLRVREAPRASVEGVLRSWVEENRHAVRVAVVAGAVAMDAASIVCAALIAGFSRFADMTEAHTLELVATVAPVYSIACLAFAAYDLRALQEPWRAASRAMVALLIAAACAACAAFALKAGSNFSRVESGVLFAAMAAFILGTRPLGAVILRRLAHYIAPRALIVTDRPAAGDGRRDVPMIQLAVPDLSDPQSLAGLFGALRRAERIILRVEERQRWIRVMQLLNVDAELLDPSLERIVPIGISDWRGTPTLVVSRGPLKPHERAMKRALDLAVVILLLPFVVPLLALLMLLVRIDSPGPALFVQERLGRQNRPYRCYKLRTMRNDLTDPTGDRSAAPADDRVTAVGRFLRQSSLDELPQLWNVLKGEMSLVGPRPHALGSKAEGALFWEVTPSYWGRHAIKPGVTGLAQVSGHRGATLRRTDLERRVEADLEYISRWSIWLDIKIIAKTLLVMRHKNAF
jgi:polysaccharide biosynthesis protein PslA